MSLPLRTRVSNKTDNKSNYADVFKQLYFYFYSNSDASRAEAIFEDIAKLLLLKIYIDRSQGNGAVQCFIEGKSSANKSLLPLLIDRFPKLISHQDKFTLGDEALRHGIKVLNNINITKAPASILGDAFQSIVGPKLRGDKGQFFTPRSLIRAMVKIANPKPEDKIVDPAAGTGGFLVEAQLYRTTLNPRNFGQLIGIEKDAYLAKLGGAMINIATDEIGEIILANSLDKSYLQSLKHQSPFEADVVLTNPPFGGKIGVTDKVVLSSFELGHQWVFSKQKRRWLKTDNVRSAQDPQVLFLELCVNLVKPGGMVGIVLPEGIFGNKNTGYILDFIRYNCFIEAIIDCPRHLFQPSTETKTNVLFLRKKGGSISSIKFTYIAVSKTCGHDRRGKTQYSNGTQIANDLETIGDAYKNRDDNDYIWSKSKLLDPYYIVPRFYNKKTHRNISKIAAFYGGEVINFDDMVKNKFIVSRKGNEVGADAYGTGEIPFIRTSDVHNYEISIDPTNGISEEIYLKYKDRQNLLLNDVILVVDGRYKIGRTAIIQNDNIKSVVQSHFRIITITNKCPIDAYEFVYILNQPEILDQMRNLVFIQSTLGSIGNRLGTLELFIPKKSDEWNDKIFNFRKMVENRALILSQLRKFQTKEIDI